MTSNWTTYKLADLTSVITKGTTPSTYGYDFEDYGINYIKAESLNYNGTVDESAFVHISLEAHEKLKRSQLQVNDILFSMAGAYLGKVGMVKESFCPANTNQAVGIIRINNSSVYPKFVEYALRNPSTVAYVNSQSGQSAQPNINLAEIGNLAFPFPTLSEQRAIASILSALDDKIELNLQMNKTLEEMATALYKHWFVDFGPFKDGEFVDSELGMIPKGWEVKRLDEIINVLSKGTTPRQNEVEGLSVEIPFLKVKDINDDGSIKQSGIEYIPNEVHEKQLKRSILEIDDILFSIAGTIGRVSIVPEQLNNSNCNQALAFVRLKDKNCHLPIVYYWLKSESTQNEIKSSIVQGVQANVSLTVLKDLKLILADPSSMAIFNLEMTPILESIFSNRAENESLTKLRDTILPKLISGEVRVKEAEKALAEVL